MIISVPDKENIIKKKCHKRVNLLYEDLRSKDDVYIKTGLGRNREFILLSIYVLPNLQMISSKRFVELLPFRPWLFINDILGLIRKGYPGGILFHKGIGCEARGSS